MRLDLSFAQNNSLLECANGFGELSFEEICVAQVGVSFVRGLEADGFLKRILSLRILSRDKIGPTQAGPVCGPIGSNCHRFLVLLGGLVVTCFLRIETA